MLPLVGEILSHAALSVPLHVTVCLLFLSTFTVWLDGLVPPCTAWKLNVVGVACSASASGNVDKVTVSTTVTCNSA